MDVRAFSCVNLRLALRSWLDKAKILDRTWRHPMDAERHRRVCETIVLDTELAAISLCDLP